MASIRPRMLRTTHGDVEVAQRGVGVPVVVLHGSPGGVDAAEAMSRFLPPEQVRTIMPSRPGYLGTPLSTGVSIDDQADLVVSVLDALGVDRACVVGVSGGGPSAYRAAARHPERVSAVVAVAAVSGEIHEEPTHWVNQVLVHSGLGVVLLDLLARVRPSEFVYNVLGSEGNLSREALLSEVLRVPSDAEQLQVLRDIVTTGIDHGSRRAGYRNDMDQFGEIVSLDLGQVQAPTLVIDGDADAEVSLEHGARAADLIEGCERIVMPEGTHLAFFVHPDARQVQERAVQFILQHAS